MEYCKDCRFYQDGNCILKDYDVSPYDRACQDFQED